MIQSNCEICIQEYDEDKHVPRSLPACGHTFCDFCIKKLLEVKRKTATLRCMVCRESSYTMKSPEDNTNYPFPKNFALISNLIAYSNHQKKKKICKARRREQKYICLWELCRQKKKFCTECFQKYHSSCQKGLRFKIKEFDKHFDADSVKSLQKRIDFDGLKNAVLTMFEVEKKKINNMIDWIHDLCKRKIYDCDFEKFNYDFIKDNREKLTLEVDEENENKIIVKWKNKEKIEQFIDYFQKKFAQKLETEFDKFIKEMFVSSSQQLFEACNSFQEDFPLLAKRFKEEQPLFLNTFLFPNSLFGDNFDFQDELCKLNSNLSDINPSFEIVETMNWTDEKMENLKKSISAAFADPNTNWSSAEKAIQAEMSKNYPIFSNYVSLDSSLIVKPETKFPYFAVLKFKDFYLTVQQKEKPVYDLSEQSEGLCSFPNNTNMFLEPRPSFKAEPQTPSFPN